MGSALCSTHYHGGKGYRRRALASLLYLAGVLSCCGVARASPLETEVDFHISAGLLADALLQFSTQANVQIAVAPHVSANLHSPGLNGRLPVTLALKKLLRNSGLAYQTVGDTVTIVQITSISRVQERAADASATLTQPR